MLCRSRDLIGRKITGADVDVGKVKDLFFDDATWDLRYVVVDTGGWLDSREVLLAPVSLRGWDPSSGVALTTGLTRAQVEASPPVTSDMPLSRAYEERLHAHYGWSPYWASPVSVVPGMYTFPLPSVTGIEPFAPAMSDLSRLPREVQDVVDRRLDDADPHLRSFREVKGYRVGATDGDIGHVEDLLIDPRTFRVSDLIVVTRNWLPGRHVVVDRAAIEAICWEDSHVRVSLTKEQVRGAPEYDAERGVDDRFQESVASYYRRSMEESGIGGGHAF